jgi:hypothetical protein
MAERFFPMIDLIIDDPKSTTELITRTPIKSGFASTPFIIYPICSIVISKLNRKF